MTDLYREIKDLNNVSSSAVNKVVIIYKTSLPDKEKKLAGILKLISRYKPNDFLPTLISIGDEQASFSQIFTNQTSDIKEVADNGDHTELLQKIIVNKVYEIIAQEKAQKKAQEKAQEKAHPFIAFAINNPYSTSVVAGLLASLAVVAIISTLGVAPAATYGAAATIGALAITATFFYMPSSLSAHIASQNKTDIPVDEDPAAQTAP